MSIRSIVALAVAVALAACGDNGGPAVASPDQLQLRIVSGDRQVARVAEAAASQHVGLYRTAATVPDNVLPEPLVARILIDGAPPQASLVSGDPTGPRFAVLPPNVAVTFRVIQPQNAGDRHCGASFIDAAVPDDSGYVVTFWERGTYAGECRMEVRLVVDQTPRVDTAFIATFEPGPAHTVELLCISSCPPMAAGDTLDLRSLIHVVLDLWRNPIDPATIPDSEVGWAWYNALADVPDPEEPEGTGWLTVVPDTIPAQYRGILIWVQGVFAGGPLIGSPD